MALSASQTAQFESDGYLTRICVAEKPDADRYRAEFDRVETAEGRDKCQIGILNRHFTEPFIWELATLPSVVDCVESLIGPDIALLATHAFCKYGDPNAKGFVAWHQDVTYWGLEPPSALTAWYAVDDSDVENGCMRVIPKSHREGVLEHGKSDSEGNLLSVNQEIGVSASDEARAVDLILKAGEMSLHDGSLIHGSLPNRSNRRRCGMTIRYISPSVKQADANSYGRRWETVIIRGKDRYGHWDHCEPPYPLP